MANDLNLFTRKLAEGFLPSFDSKRVLSKNVNTQKLSGRFKAGSGENVDFARPTDYTTVRSATGDVSGATPDNIITGKATGTVQPYFTSFVEFDEADEAVNMGEGAVSDLLRPMATRMVTDLELDFGQFMSANSALLAGTVGTAVSTWDDVAEAGAIMESSGVPMDNDWLYASNPFTKRSLASDQRSLGGETGKMDANEKALITAEFAGMRVMSATTLPSYRTFLGADRAGTVVGTPVATYVAAKDTMTQVIGVTGFEALMEIAAGETVTITGVNRLNLSTRQVILDDSGAPIVFSGTVTSAVVLGASGEGNITITGPAIFEDTAGNGAYNTVEQAISAGAVITLGGASDTIIQPNMFWHKEAFSIGSVPIKKLSSTDTVATTEDGLQFRVSMGSNFLENQNKVRIDFRPAYAALNPFFAGKGFGNP